MDEHHPHYPDIGRGWPDGSDQTPRSRKTPRTKIGLLKRKRILRAHGNRCFYCGTPLVLTPNHPRFVTIDHRIPRSRGGTNEFSNLVPACRNCNQEKGDSLP